MYNFLMILLESPYSGFHLLLVLKVTNFALSPFPAGYNIMSNSNNVVPNFFYILLERP